jgi:hypothetical protein
MRSNFRDVVNRVGFYSAEVVSPPGAVIFHFHAWKPEVEAVPVSGPGTEPFRIGIDKLLNVRYIHGYMKSLPKSE